MKQYTDVLLGACVGLASGLLIIGLLANLNCSASEPKNVTSFEKCLDAITPPKKVWTLFGSINVEDTKSAAVKECKELGIMELRAGFVKEHAKKSAETTKAANKAGKLTDRQKLEFIMKGIPTKTSW